MPKYRTTTKDFEIFAAEVVKWVHRFGLTEWQLEIEHAPLEDAGRYAELKASPGVLSVIFYLNTTWLRDPKPKEIEATAFHEVAHLLLMELTHAAGERYVSQTVVQKAEESIVIRLENAIQPFSPTIPPTGLAAGRSNESTGKSGPPSSRRASSTSSPALNKRPSSWSALVP